MSKADALTTELLPCPFCGAQPTVDCGLSDAPFPDGQEFISCPTVRLGVFDQGCGASAVGAAAWNNRATTTAAAYVAGLEVELAWYGEQARLCRLIHSEGDAGRHALSNDGGKRALAVLKGGA
ncbi:MAG: hypothetical protein V4712_15085 [Pseudomonadota bacterium]